MKNKIFRRFYLLNIATVIVAMLMMMIMVSVSVSSYLTREKRTMLTEYCQAVTDAVYTDTSAFGIKNYMRTLVLTGNVIDSDVLLTNSAGEVKYCTCTTWQQSGSCDHVGKTLGSSVTGPAMKGQYYGIGTLDGLYSEAHHTVGLPVEDKYGRVVGAVFASTPASLLEEWLKNFSRIFVLSAILPLLLTCIVIYVYTSHMLRPIRMMSDASKRLANGDFSKRIYCDRDDEIAELAHSFNTMTDSLAQLEGMRRSFVANVSHELRTPMTTIGGFIDGILDGTVEPEKQTYYLEIVSGEVKRLSGVVQSMLTLSRLESGEQQINKTDFDLLTVLCDVFISQERRIGEKKISVEGLDSFEAVTVCADKDLFYQVIYNLVDNAIKFTPVGGKISVRAEQRESGPVFSIKNSGDGIAEKDLALVFDRFYKADKSRSSDKRSSGLGLHIVKSIVDLHAGTITVRSAEGEYTEFVLTLPSGSKAAN